MNFNLKTTCRTLVSLVLCGYCVSGCGSSGSDNDPFFNANNPGFNNNNNNNNNNNPVVATQLGFVAQPSNVATGVSINPPVQVAIRDANGNTVTTANNAVTLAIGQNPGSSTLSGTLTVNAVNGVATFNDIKLNNAGNGYTLTASAAGLTGATSQAFNVAASALNLSFAAPVTKTLDGGNGGGSGQDMVAVGDINGDGKQDFVVANSGTNRLSIFQGNGDGTFQPEVFADTAAGPVSVQIGDFNGDGKPDLVSVSPSQVSFLAGNGTFSFPARVDTAAGTSNRSIVKLDVDGDNDLDLALSDFGGDRVVLLVNNGAGTFAVQNYSSGGVLTGARSIKTGDFNGDSRPDLAIASFSQGDGGFIWLNSGTAANFFPAANLSKPLVASDVDAASTSLAVGDLNNDGKADVAQVFTDGADAKIVPSLGEGNGTFTAGAEVLSSGDPFSVALADFNLDGKLDAVSVSAFGLNNNGTGEADVFRGNGDGSLQNQAVFAAPNGTVLRSVAVGDFNGDNKPDIVAVGSTAQIFINTSN